MTDDKREGRRVEAILAGNKAPTEEEVKELREMVGAVDAMLQEERPPHDDIVAMLKNMLRMYRPMTGEDIGRYARGEHDG